MEATIILIN